MNLRLLVLLMTLSAGCSRSIPESELPATVENGIGMKFVLVHSGSFTMGTPETEPERDADEQQHEVRLSKPYYLGVYEVTQAQYTKVMGENPSRFQKDATGVEDTSNFPVDSLCWADAEKFCLALTDLPEERKAGRRYRLPTEAEWEYACRAQTESAYSFGDEPALLNEYGWFEDNSDQRSHPVGEKKPNPWGLYDMHGNVSELCADFYIKKLEDATDPFVFAMDEHRCRRGSGWFFEAKHCRSGARDSWPPDGRPANHGLRVVLMP